MSIPALAPRIAPPPFICRDCLRRLGRSPTARVSTPIRHFYHPSSRIEIPPYPSSTWQGILSRTPAAKCRSRSARNKPRSELRLREPRTLHCSKKSEEQAGPGASHRPLASSSRCFHTLARNRQQAAAAASTQTWSQDSFTLGTGSSAGKRNIRESLRDWQASNFDQDARFRPVDFETEPGDAEAQNESQIPENGQQQSDGRMGREEEEDSPDFDDTGEAIAQELDQSPAVKRFMRVGDLVELNPNGAVTESTVALFIQATESFGGLVLTMRGRWQHVSEGDVYYNIPGWASESEVEPLLQYLPSAAAESVSDGYFNDLSIPRPVSAPLVDRMVQFYTESQSVYRQHVKSLDRAHELLADETDLRHSTLTSVATTLLGIPEDQLTPPAIWATRSALVRNGFMFRWEFHHRVTGIVKILPKAQVASASRVRHWLRAWQDDLARTANMRERALERHRPRIEARYVYDFVERARKIILEHRKDRQFTSCGSIGPSRKRFPISPTTGSVVMMTGTEFTPEDKEIVKFLYTWACHGFTRDSRLESLPPLLLQKMGCYTSEVLGKHVGWVFLQEIGTILPYDSPIRHSQALQLPTGQQSRLQYKLMRSIMEMRRAPNFSDSMADLRHDWKDLPVFCVDDASAQEIDDGFSIEDGGTDSSGQKLHWIHVHIANPTAFFSKDHDLAKMAAHIGETIYMPERNYMMMPRWASTQHFSLANNRPSLTFSCKMNDKGDVIEHTIKPGIVRNVISLTYAEVGDVLGDLGGAGSEGLDLVVGGSPPPAARQQRPSMLPRLTPRLAEDLKTLNRLARLRNAYRTTRGGVDLGSNGNSINVNVFQAWNGPGLAWDEPHFKGSRRVDGDPVIRFTAGLPYSQIARAESAGNGLVREMMLLACETAALWCAERQLPFLYRGTLKSSETPDPREYARNVIEPQVREISPTGEWPIHLTSEYARSAGIVTLNPRPHQHVILGLKGFTKVTSPLRRYGDMLAHWQIQAALREEARLGRSLVGSGEQEVTDRPFLPMTTGELQSMIPGLEARERLIQKAKREATAFWVRMLLFRAIHFGEIALPIPTKTVPLPRLPGRLQIDSPEFLPRSLPPDQYYVHSLHINVPPRQKPVYVNGNSMTFFVEMSMARPEQFGLPPAQNGDVWEVCIVKVSVFDPTIINWPLRLLERDGKPYEQA